MSPLKLLIASVDDELVDAITEALAVRGFLIVHARDPLEAQDAVELCDIDIALVDEDLRYGVDGDQQSCAASVLEQVRHVRPLVRRVLLTEGASLDSNLVDADARRRAQTWLLKPLVQDQLDDVISSVVSQALRRQRSPTRAVC